ncbi:MAG: hypothetical protein GY904_35570 [Planctomycetaceae bacterium]|nr:hypothetical protein [Planctomycetaceae bacterium]
MKHRRTSVTGDAGSGWKDTFPRPITPKTTSISAIDSTAQEDSHVEAPL